MNWDKIKKHDWTITVISLLLMVLGLLVIFSTTYTTTDAARGAGSAPKQIIFLIIGFIAYFMVMSIDFSWFENRSIIKIIYIVIILLLLYVKFFGITTAGTNRWIYIGFFSLQPSEYAKIVIILVTAAVYSYTESQPQYLKSDKHKRPKRNLFSVFTPLLNKVTDLIKIRKGHLEYLKLFLFNLLLVLPLLVLTLIQPSLGNTIISFAIWAILVLVLFPSPKRLLAILVLSFCFVAVALQFFNVNIVAGKLIVDLLTEINWFLIVIFLLAILVVAFITKTKLLHVFVLGVLTFTLLGGFYYAWNYGLTTYQRTRIETFIAGPESDPTGAGYQVIQSKIAIGSGMVFGRGFLQGTQSSLNVLTQAFTDFVFAAFAEQFGFIGSMLVLSLYLILIVRIIRVGGEASTNYGKFVALGIAVLILTQVFINIGMNLGKLPVTGITLPLMSYGGSSILMTMICLGLVQSIYTSRKPVDIADNLMLISQSLVIKEK